MDVGLASLSESALHTKTLHGRLSGSIVAKQSGYVFGSKIARIEPWTLIGTSVLVSKLVPIYGYRRLVVPPVLTNSYFEIGHSEQVFENIDYQLYLVSIRINGI